MRLTFALTGLLLTMVPALLQAAEPPADLAEELRPLHRYAGTWQKEFESTQGEEKVKKSGTHTSKWILKNRFLQEEGKDSDGTMYLSVMRYDPDTQQFKLTFFQSTGFSSTLTGTFDAATSTFTFKDSNGGGSFVGTNQFVDADTYKMHYQAKGPDGKVQFQISGTAKRVKP